MWIKLFDFSIKHISERKYNVANNLSQRSKNSLLNEKVNTVDDFINLQLNNIQIYSVFVKKSEASAVLKK